MLGEYLGLTKIEYSEYEDDYYGYFSFKYPTIDAEVYTDKIHIYCKKLDECID